MNGVLQQNIIISLPHFVLGIVTQLIVRAILRKIKIGFNWKMPRPKSYSIFYSQGRFRRTYMTVPYVNYGKSLMPGHWCFIDPA